MQYIENSSAADDRKNLDYEELFGNDSGEDENPDILAGYFFQNESFKKAYDTTKPFEIIKAKKGMGKSALLSHLKYRLHDQSHPIDASAVVIKVTGNELIGLADFSGTDSALMENRWKQVICKRISMELAKEIGFAGSDTSMVLVEAAEIEGYKGRNLVSGLMSRLGSVVEVASKALSGGVAAIATSKPTDPQTLKFENILRRVQDSADRNVWLLVDDIDAKFVDTPELQTRVGAFFSAARSLAYSVDGLRVRASVRTDVWSNLRRMEDQDKIRQYVIEIKWTSDQLRSIFAKKILVYLQKLGGQKYAAWNEAKNYQDIVDEVFNWDYSANDGWHKDPLQMAMVLAGMRPRWMGQLCKQAGSAAGTSKIEKRDFSTAMHLFGPEKISDSIKEHQHQFAELQKVIDTFRGGEGTYTRHKLLELLEKGFVAKIGATSVPPVNGFPYQSVDQIALLLYQIDFIGGVKNRKYIPFHSDPTLFECKANTQNQIPWQINISYRGFLLAQM
jgi:hypothetical protein